VDVRVLGSAVAVAEAAADAVCELVAEKPAATLGLATGRTQHLLYEELCRRHRAGRLSLALATTFNLDEYLGMDADDPRTFRHFMDECLFRHVDLQPDRAHLPPSRPADPHAAAAAYEARIQAVGGIDLQLIGIGRNGHIGFNEPTSSLGSRTRVKTLSTGTLEANALQPAGGVQTAITMGIGTILDARRLLLLATGAEKAEAIAAAIEGPLSARCPASALQLHPAATVLIDRDAASRLTLLEYYRTVDAARSRVS